MTNSASRRRLTAAVSSAVVVVCALAAGTVLLASPPAPPPATDHRAGRPEASWRRRVTTPGAAAAGPEARLRVEDARPVDTFLVRLDDRSATTPGATLPDGEPRDPGGASAPRQLGRHGATLADLVAAGLTRAAALDDALEALEATGDVTSVELFPAFGLLAVHGTASAAEALARAPGVAEVWRNRVHRVSFPSPPNGPEPRSWVARAARGLEILRWPQTGAEGSGGDLGLWPNPASPNLDAVGAARAWAELGATGEGATVAVMDTGADWRHPALVAQYRGGGGGHDYHWFDATQPGRRDGMPEDVHGHGTHVTGLVAGRGANGVLGVAPGAEWIAVRVFVGDETTDLILLRGAAWLLAPTRLGGGAPRPDLAPDIVNCSWSLENGADSLLAPIVAAWRASGILPVFAAGNTDGGFDAPDRVLAPSSDPGVLAVGALGTGGNLWWRSRRGPGFHDVVKPDLTAPGEAVLSAWPNGRSAFLDGTSMAAPHVAGAAALVLGANPGLSVDDVGTFLRAFARDLGPVGPDTTYGWGAVDAFASVSSAQTAGRVAGRLLDQGGRGVGGGMVEADLRSAAPWRAATDEGGFYDLALPAGTMRLAASAFGFAPRSEPAAVVAGETLALDFVLSRAASAVVTGRLSSAADKPLDEARVGVVGESVAADVAADGRYELALPAGRHRLRFAASAHRAATATLAVSPGQALVRDVSLSSAPRILLVDADAWDQERIGPYFERALADAGYAFGTLTLDDPREAPDLDTLLAYEVVIWSHVYNSPGRLDGIRGDKHVTTTLADYVARGGRLILTGQDVGAYDARQQRRPGLAPDFYARVLGAALLADGPPGLASAEGRGPLAGLALDLRWPGGAEKGWRPILPDVVAPSAEAGGAAEPILVYADGGAAALGVSGADGRRAYLAFGPESAGDRAALAALLDGLIAWLEPPALALEAAPKAVAPGDGVVLSLTARAGRSSAHAQLTLALPRGLALEPEPGAARVNGQGWRWEGSLDPDEPRSFALDARLVGPAAGSVRLPITATLISAARVATATTGVQPLTPDIDRSTLVATPGRLAGAGVVTVTLRLVNDGAAPAGAGAARIDPPPGMAVLTGTLATTGGAVGWSPGGSHVDWHGLLSPDVPVEVRFAGHLPDGVGSAHAVRATIDDGAGRLAALEAPVLVGGPDLAASRWASAPATVLAGWAFTPTIVVTNTGRALAEGRVTLHVPDGIRPAGDRGSVWSWSGPIAPGASVPLPVPLAAEADAPPGPRALEAEIADGRAPEGVVRRTAEIRVQRPDLGASRVVLWPDGVRSGGVLTAAVLVHNAGDAAVEADIVDAMSPSLVTMPGTVRASAGRFDVAPGTVHWRVTAVPRSRGDYAARAGGAAVLPRGGMAVEVADRSVGRGAPVGLGMAFPYFTEVYTRAWITDDGLLAFGLPDASADPVFGPHGASGAPLIAPLWRAGPSETPRRAWIVRGADAVTVTWTARDALGEGSRSGIGDPGAFAVVLEPSGRLAFLYGPQAATAGAQAGLRGPGVERLVVPPEDLRPGRRVDIEGPGGWAWLTFQTRVGAGVPPNGLVQHTARLRANGPERALAAAARVNRLRLAAGVVAWPRTPAAGSRVAYTLAVAAEGDVAARDVEAWAAVPDAGEVSLESLSPGLVYDAASDTLRWRGTLAAGERRDLAWSVRLGADLPVGAQVATRAGARAKAETVPEVDLIHRMTVQSADLSGSAKRVSRSVARPGDVVTFTLRVANGGARPARVEVTDALPTELTYVPRSAWASTGEVPAWDAGSRSLRWRGAVAAGGAAEVRFEARFEGDAEVANVMRVTEEGGAHVAAWAEVRRERARVWLPLVASRP